MVSLLEIFCIWAVTTSFMKYPKKWKANLFSTIMMLGMFYQYLQITFTTPENLNKFRKGVPMCTPSGRCVYYSALVMSVSGQLIWKYLTFTSSTVTFPTKKQLFYFGIHSLPVLGFMLGFNWNFRCQFFTDLLLLLTISFLEGSSQEQFDRSNYEHVRRTLNRHLNR